MIAVVSFASLSADFIVLVSNVAGGLVELVESGAALVVASAAVRGKARDSAVGARSRSPSWTLGIRFAALFTRLDVLASEIFAAMIARELLVCFKIA